VQQNAGEGGGVSAILFLSMPIHRLAADKITLKKNYVLPPLDQNSFLLMLLHFRVSAAANVQNVVSLSIAFYHYL